MPRMNSRNAERVSKNIRLEDVLKYWLSYVSIKNEHFCRYFWHLKTFMQLVSQRDRGKGRTFFQFIKKLFCSQQALKFKLHQGKWLMDWFAVSNQLVLITVCIYLLVCYLYLVFACVCVTEWVPHRNMEHNHSHRELFVCAHCPWTSAKASLKLCWARFFVYSTSFQICLSAADQSDGPRLRKRLMERQTDRQADRQMLCNVNLVLAFWHRVCDTVQSSDSDFSGAKIKFHLTGIW